MTTADRSTAEEFYARCASNAIVLDEAARRFSRDDDAVGALSAAWGSDVFTAMAVVWERIMIASRAPQRRLFEVAVELIGGLQHASPATGSAREVIRAARSGILTVCEADLRRSLEEAWADIDYLEALAAPTAADVAAWVAARLDGMSVPAYIQARLRESAEAMEQAQAARIRNDTPAAVQAAYTSDFLALEAYLVESAVAAGDDSLTSVSIRWELATHAVTEITGLPDSFMAAVTTIRHAMWVGLGDADGDRLISRLADI